MRFGWILRVYWQDRRNYHERSDITKHLNQSLIPNRSKINIWTKRSLLTPPPRVNTLCVKWFDPRHVWCNSWWKHVSVKHFTPVLREYTKNPHKKVSCFCEGVDDLNFLVHKVPVVWVFYLRTNTEHCSWLETFCSLRTFDPNVRYSYSEICNTRTPS